MEEQYLKTVRALERRIKELEQELAQSHRDIVSVREKWFGIFEELEKEFNKKLSAANKKAQEMEERALRAEAQRNEALDKAARQRHRIYEAETELEEEKGKNLKLRAQLNRDHENSSCTSAQNIRAKRSVTAGKSQAENPEDSRDIRDTAAKGRFPQGKQCFLILPKKSWKTWISSWCC